jgi:type III pantothenate kinase
MRTDGVLLALDIGNSRVKWGHWQGGAWVASGAFATAHLRSDAQLLPLARVTRAVACNVAGAAALAQVEALLRRVGAPLTLVQSSASGAGVRNGYAVPASLGVDRWAGLIAAHNDMACHQLVVMAGTALTVDALTREGEFLGGVIAPGLGLMRESLAAGTAQLPLADAVSPGFPDNTNAAIGTGTLLAAIGVIEGMRARLCSAGRAAERVVLAGGAAQALQVHLSTTVHRPFLVLDGLRRLVEE